MHTPSIVTPLNCDNIILYDFVILRDGSIHIGNYIYYNDNVFLFIILCFKLV
jgi:hypothetical protein